MSATASIFKGFEPTNQQAWLDAIKAELKGEAIEKLMVQTPEGIQLQPFYTLNDTHGLVSASFDHQPWEIRQDFNAADEVAANKLALAALNGGVNALGFYLQPGTNLRKLLQGIQVQHISTHFMEGMNVYRLVDDFVELLEERGLNAADIKGSITWELMDGVEEEKDRTEIPAYFNELSSLLPAFRVITVALRDDVDKATALGMALAKTHEYLYIMAKAGIDISSVLDKLQFNVSVGNQYFMEVATLRALRQLVPQVTAAYTTVQPSIYLHCNNQLGDETKPYDSMIAATAQCMAAIAGGADSISINVLEANDQLAFLQRIARNTQLILQQEAKQDKVIDPGAGSYYIERLTHQLATNAWEVFKGIEAQEGYFVKYAMFL